MKKITDDLRKSAGGAVRISMPAAVANDLDAFKKGITIFAERLGCPACFSGYDCRFESERDFVFDADLKLTPTSAGPGLAVSRGARQREVSVKLSPAAEFDLDWILEKIDLIGRRFGSHWEQGGQAWCCSGFDITFERELQYVIGDGPDRL